MKLELILFWFKRNGFYKRTLLSLFTEITKLKICNKLIFYVYSIFHHRPTHFLMSRPNFRLLKMILSTTYFNTWILPHPSNFCQITSDFPYCFVLRTKILQVKLKDYPFISLRYWCYWCMSIQSLDIVLSNASRYFGILR